MKLSTFFFGIFVVIATHFNSCCLDEAELTNLSIQEMKLGSDFAIGIPSTVVITVRESFLLECGSPIPAGWTQTRFSAEWSPEGEVNWEPYQFTTNQGPVNEFFIETPPTDECSFLSTISLEVTVNDPGSYRFTAEADGSNSIDESNEIDNTFLLEL